MAERPVPPAHGKDDSDLPPLAPVPLGDDELAQEIPQDTAASQQKGTDVDSLKVSENLKARIRELERAGTKAQFRHRLSLIGAAELDESRTAAQRSGAMLLLEAVYAHGDAHWLDPVKAIMPLREIMFKMKAPPVTDRGVFYVMTKLARAGVSPAAFATHVILPRMATDHDWRAWRGRHTWILDAIADVLISLRSAAPWNGGKLGSTTVLADVALCKYVGRPLARLVGERFSGQEEYLDEWREAWRSFAFRSPTFLAFMRRVILPCLYRLSGRIDPEQLAPIGRAMAGLERTLGRRLQAMSSKVADDFMAEAGLWDTFEARIARRSSDGAGSVTIARELRAYIELASELSAIDSGLPVLGRVASLSLQLDADFLADAVLLARQVARTEGAGCVRWHLDALGRIPPAQRPAFIEETRAGRGLHPSCPFRGTLDLFAIRDDARELASRLGLSADEIEAIAHRSGGQVGINQVRARYLAADPARAKLYEDIADDVAAARDREWREARLAALDAPGEAYHELVIRSLVPGLGSGFSLGSLKARSFGALWQAYPKAVEGKTVPIRATVRLPAENPGGGEIEPAGRDAARARVAIDFLEATWGALTAKDPDPECGAAFAEFGQQAAATRKSYEAERSRAIEAEGKALEGAKEAAGNKADSAPKPDEDRKVRALADRMELFDNAFGAMEEVPPDKRDARRFAMAALLASYLCKAGDKPCLAVLAAAVARYADDAAVAAIVKRLRADVAPGFLGVEQAALIADAVDALSAAMAADSDLAGALAWDDSRFAAAAKKAAKLRGTGPSADSFDHAWRKAAGYARITGETAKWRDLLAKLGKADEARRDFSFCASRSPLDAYYGDMGAICLSAHPELVNRPGVIVGRLWDVGERRLRGMCLFVYAQAKKPGFSHPKFWHAFAFNPLRSLTRGMGTRELLALYLGFRKLAEELSLATKTPVLASGPSTAGLLSNDASFSALIRNYEAEAGSPCVNDAYGGFSVYYAEPAFAEAIVIADPANPGSFNADRQLKSLGMQSP